MDDKRNGSADYRDERSGAYDPVNEAGKPQPNQVPEAITPRQAKQNGGDVRHWSSSLPLCFPKDCGARPEGL